MRDVFARIGTAADLERAIENAQASPVVAMLYPGSEVTVDRDEEAETVAVNVGKRNAFRALHKGGGVWLFIYSKEFYQP